MPSKKDLTNTFELSKYYNKWVATLSQKDRRIIAYGDSPEEALTNAVKESHENPIARFLPRPSKVISFGIN